MGGVPSAAAGGRGRGRNRLHPTGSQVTRRRAGDPIVRGRLTGLEGRFRLAPGLTTPGAIGVNDAAVLVVAEMRTQAAAGWITDDAADTYTRFIGSMVKYVTARGAVSVADITVNVLVDWIAAPSVRGQSPKAMQGLRRAAARAFFRLCARLGLYDQNPAVPIEVGPKYTRYVNPFTNQQIAHLKATACYREGETRVPATIGLLLCGVTAGETGSIRVDHVNVEARQVLVPDAGSQFVRARSVPIDDPWCVNALTARIAALRASGGDGSTWLVYQGTSSKETTRNSAVSNVVTDALKRARLHQPGVTRLTSITEWVALDAYERSGGDVAYVANLLGMSSLDAAADLVGHQWTTNTVDSLAARSKPAR